jgi:hypothetical protein
VTLRFDLTGPTDASELGELSGQVKFNEGAKASLGAAQLPSKPDQFALIGNYPNPFTQSTTISFNLPSQADVTLEVYDMLGRRVMLQPKKAMSAGEKKAIKVQGRDLSSGVYLYRLKVETNAETMVKSGRMVVVK